MPHHKTPRYNFTRNFRGLGFLLASTALIACGGSGSRSSGGTTGTGSGSGGGTGTTGPTYTQGVFEAASKFQAQCASPRTGTNPATNSRYPDTAGSTTLENHWLRSWSNDTYLWYNQITDRNPASYTDRLAYFDLLKTDAVTASGTPVDQFHFTYTSEEYYELSTSGSSSGFGAKFALIQRTAPRDIRVSYVQSGSNADGKLFRGTKILEVDGHDVVNSNADAAIDAINGALFPENDGVSHTLLVQDAGASTSRTITLVTQTVSFDPAPITKTIQTNGGDIVGYIAFNTFGTATAEKAIVDAVTDLQAQNIDDLVLDLRYNGGGYLDISAELGYMIAGASSSGSVFDGITFNDKHTTVNPVTGATIRPTMFLSTGQGFSVNQGTALPTLDLPKVYILSTDRTCSASEALINGLRGIDVEVVLIGSTTCGKPYGFYATDNCGITYFTVQFKGANAKGFGDYSDGFVPNNTTATIGERIPGCDVGDDFDHPLGDENEALLSAALGHIATGNCPMDTIASSSLKSSAALSDQDMLSAIGQTPAILAREYLSRSNILNAPHKK